MTKDKDAIIERVRKILALAGNNSNEAEAMVAAEKAQALLAEHNLSIADVTKKSGKVDDGFIVDEELSTDAYPWRRKIAYMVARLYFSAYFFQPDKRGKTMYDVHCFVGARHNIEVAKLMFHYLHTTVDRLAREGAKSIPKEQRSPYRVSFRQAATNRLCTRIQARIDEARKGGTIKGEKGNTLPALASLYDTIGGKLSKFVEENVGEVKPAKERTFKRQNFQGQIDGRKAGDAIGLEAQVTSAGDSNKLAAPAPALPAPEPFVQYENTAENAERIGWRLVPNKCSGDPTAKYVIHNTVLGTFKFTNKKKEAK
jgi:hypothetical protein